MSEEEKLPGVSKKDQKMESFQKQKFKVIIHLKFSLITLKFYMRSLSLPLISLLFVNFKILLTKPEA